jgi:tetrahydromethanopterin S-methyltransferase subunit B
MEGEHMAAGDRKTAGISVGGIIVIGGILAILFWSFWIGLVIVLIGLIAFGGFARGKWY